MNAQLGKRGVMWPNKIGWGYTLQGFALGMIVAPLLEGHILKGPAVIVLFVCWLAGSRLIRS